MTETFEVSREESFEILDLRRREDGVMEATVRYESGLTAVREVKSVSIEAVVHRGDESRELGLQDENLGVVAATYRNPEKEILARQAGIGTVEVSCE